MKADSGSNVRVSVVIVTYNSEEEIGACLEAVIPQVKEVGGEIIVVDNASRDGTVDVIESFRKEKPQITLITLIENDHNLGFSSANNQVLETAKGEFTFFLNPDTQLRAETIEKLTFLLSSSNDAGAAAPQLQFPDGTIQHSCRRFPTYGSLISEMLGLSRLFPTSRFFNGWKMGDFNHTRSREVDQPAAAALMVRTDLFRELGGFDPDFPMFFSDVDLCRRIWERKKILFYPGAAVVHHGGASVKRAKPKMIVSSHLSFIRYFNKYHKGFLNRIMNGVMAVLLLASMGARVLWATVLPESKSSRRDAL